MSRRILCTIVDDDASNAETLKGLLLKHVSIEVEQVFTDPLIFLDRLDNLKSKVIFLDIEMPGITGLALARRLSNRTVVFVSGHKEYADEAFDLEVLDFVKKPIQETRLIQAVQRINKKFNWMAGFANFPTATGEVRVEYENIICITTAENDSRDKELFLINSDKVLLIKNRSLDELMNLLDPECFFRIRSRCVVNLKRVVSRSKSRMIQLGPLKGGGYKEEEVSEKYWKDFLIKADLH
jgi:DNA-binding LytR/AlgR family response regulator